MADRQDWADVAKGVCILLVVLVHVTNKQYLTADWDWNGAPSLWGLSGHALTPLRMPLFFLISGYFIHRSLSRTWNEVYRKRLISPYYLYVVWLAIHTVFWNFGPPLATESVSSVADGTLNLFLGTTSLWYLYALAAYFVFVWMLRKAPAWVPVAGSLLIAFAGVLVGHMLPGNGDSLLMNLVFYVAGARFPTAVATLVRNSRVGVLGISGIGFVVLVGVIYGLRIDRVPGLAAIAGVSAVWFGLTASVILSRFRYIRIVGGWTGRNTLPLYVLHLPVLAVCEAIVPVGGFIDSRLAAIVWPVVMTTVVTLLAFALHQVLLWMRLRFLFGLPDRYLNGTSR